MKKFIRRFKLSGPHVLAIITVAAVAARAEDPWLGAPAYRDGQFYFDLHGESKAGYIILSTTDFAEWTTVATNEGVSAVGTLVSPAAQSRAFFKVQRLPLAIFRFGMVAKDTVYLFGNTVTSDSFDSADSNYSSNGLYTQSKHKDHDDIALNSSLTDSFLVGNAKIWGAVFTESVSPDQRAMFPNSSDRKSLRDNNLRVFAPSLFNFLRTHFLLYRKITLADASCL